MAQIILFLNNLGCYASAMDCLNGTVAACLLFSWVIAEGLKMG